MKYFLLAALLSTSLTTWAQKPQFTPRTISLPQEIADRNNQFSGLFIRGGQLFLLGESRLQERAEAKVYAVDLASIDGQLAQKSQEVAYKKYSIRNLDKVRAHIDSLCQVYEGLEGLTMVGNTAYFTIETTTPSAYCYLIKGTVDDAGATITIDTRYLVPLAKPALTDGSHIHNAGFEAATGYNKSLLLLFEYNYFTHDNYAFRIPDATDLPDIPQYVPVARLPFRVTDLVYEGKNRFTAINYFYNGDDDQVYRTPAPDPNAHLVLQDGKYQNYCRLISLRYKRNKISWKPLFELPREYMTYNWEGLAAYKSGYFLMNDKYGPSNQSTLLYLQKR
ncbi:hypothetical protein HMJ29_12000 [Hymenobacter taeanensis]|uniref:Uncharacterized protein n=1 Tax=Hymenobacter taeanensis TaxID=2735321 RepID=A0A6M6BKP4_9BACT|nr:MULTISPECIES: hypothetical protein [Hymenobacter]QJX47625.1 hypothetical protein HMJ29_12000 [Hymenobacter taeanensis]UOQ82892.1 hypothetical protein MUN83_09080 [Hymenobacter sp. 5414T-23]